jgi:hydrogenase-4 component B
MNPLSAPVSFFSYAADPLSLFFVGIILLVAVPAAVHSIGYLRGEYAPGKIAFGWALLAGFVASMIAVVTAANALLFLVAWEAMSLISYFLVVFDTEDAKSVKAGTVYIVMTHVGTAFITAAFLVLYRYSGSFEFAAFRTACATLPAQTKNILFLLFLVGFGTKAGVIPLHVWLPYAHPQAPSHISAVMSGVMIKTAIYGIIRFIIVILGVDAWWWGNLILVLGAVSCLAGVIYALMEHDIKRLLAYHSVENIGIILLGIGASMVCMKTGQPVLAVLALAAGLYHTLNHAVFKSLLFLCAGNVFKATEHRNIEEMGGLIKRMPWTAAAFLVGSLAISAMPPFNGFVSEWLTFQSLFLGAVSGPSTGKILFSLYASVLALTGGLAAACFVKAFGTMFLAMPRSVSAERAREAAPSMTGPVVFLAACTLVLGLGASPVLSYLQNIASSAIGFDDTGVRFTLNNFALMPQPGAGTRLSVPLVVLVMGILFAGLAGGLRFFFGKTKTSIVPTWGCGYYRLGPRTEYTATAFSKPFRIAFSFFLKPYHKTERIAESPYHVKSMRYEVFTTPVIKEYVYGTALSFLLRSAKWMRRLQTGSIHIYIAYIFITIVVLILCI